MIKKYLYMLISAIISIIISAVIFNYSVISDNFFNKGEAITMSAKEVGLVLGAEASEAVIKGFDEINKASAIYDDTKLPFNEDKEKAPDKLSGALEIAVKAKSGAVLDSRSGELLFDQDANKITSIASITKLMTALVFLDYNPGWETIYEIKEGDRREGGKIYLYLGDKVLVKDLFFASLVGSANTATAALVHSTGLSEEEFVTKMNKKAMDIGLINTYFNDPVGLNNYNTSTAKEVALIAKAALAHKDIRDATLTKEYKFKTLSGREKIILTTDHLLDSFNNNGIKLIGGKTGYTEAAGYCFVGVFIDEDGNEIISVVLGSPADGTRFKETKKMVQWSFESFVWE